MTGEKPTPEDIIKVCKIFKDDLTLDNLSRPQLVSICRYMNIPSFGTDNILRYQVRVRMFQSCRLLAPAVVCAHMASHPADSGTTLVPGWISVSSTACLPRS
jgi:hypothetical protein